MRERRPGSVFAAFPGPIKALPSRWQGGAMAGSEIEAENDGNLRSRAALEEEPRLKYNPLGGESPRAAAGAGKPATRLCVSDKVLAVGHRDGSVQLLDHLGNQVRWGTPARRLMPSRRRRRHGGGTLAVSCCCSVPHAANAVRSMTPPLNVLGAGQGGAGALARGDRPLLRRASRVPCFCVSGRHSGGAPPRWPAALFVAQRSPAGVLCCMLHVALFACFNRSAAALGAAAVCSQGRCTGPARFSEPTTACGRLRPTLLQVYGLYSEEVQRVKAPHPVTVRVCLPRRHACCLLHWLQSSGGRTPGGPVGRAGTAAAAL